MGLFLHSSSASPPGWESSTPCWRVELLHFSEFCASVTTQTQQWMEKFTKSAVIWKMCFHLAFRGLLVFQKGKKTHHNQASKCFCVSEDIISSYLKFLPKFCDTSKNIDGNPAWVTNDEKQQRPVIVVNTFFTELDVWLGNVTLSCIYEWRHKEAHGKWNQMIERSMVVWMSFSLQ